MGFNIEAVEIKDREFELLRKLVYERSGINLNEGKKSLVQGRLNKLLKTNGFSTFRQYYDHITDDKTGDALTAIRESAGSDDELVDAIDALSRTLRERIGESIKSTHAGTPLARATTPSLVALQKYTLADRLSASGGDVERTIALLEEAIAIDSTFAMAHRKLEDDVPQEVKMARLHAIEQLEAGVSDCINRRLLGQEVEVLVEGQKPNSNGEPTWYGRTRGNKLVHFSGDADSGDLVTVRIDRASAWSLLGEVVAPAVLAAR